MGAPTPYSGPLPLIFTGSYLKRQNGVGNAYVPTFLTAPGSLGGGTVFDNLVNPPSGGVTAEAKSLTRAQAVGTTALTSPTNGKSYYTAATVTAMVKKNFDFVMNFYLENSIARDGSGHPIP